MLNQNLGKLLEAQNKITKYETNHILHLLLSVFTAGIWIPFWILTAVSNGIERAKGDRMLKKAMEG